VPTGLIFANTNFVVKCRKIRPRLNGRYMLIVNDGLGMDLAALAIHGRRFSENLNGTDFIPYFFRNSAQRQRVFLVGGVPGIAEAAAKVIESKHGQKVVGCVDGFEGLRDPFLIQRINDARADVVLVAMGNPRQEEWIIGHLPLLNSGLLVGVGALFDFMAGRKKRAPQWIRSLRCEWLYRLAGEPRRLMRRYTIDIWVFFARCLRRRQQTVGMILGSELDIVPDTGVHPVMTLTPEELAKLGMGND
jgi:beta-1,4-glucosyltransferase